MTSWSDAGEMQCLATATNSEMNMLTGKTILVTGAAQGIGFHTASLALRRGANVVALDRDSHRLLQAFPESNVVRLAGDVTDTAFMQHHARLLGEVDGVVNAAAIVAQGNLLECSVDQLRLSLEVNVVGIHNILASVLPGMLQRKNGSIVNIASVVSSIKGLPNRHAYATSKGAVIGLTKAVAADFVRQGIRCNAICPGTVDTPSLRDRASAGANPDAALAEFAARQPMGRLGTPEEIAPLICHLLSGEASFTTGAVFVCDGGLCM